VLPLPQRLLLVIDDSPTKRYAFFGADPNATVAEILDAFAPPRDHRAGLHDVKEVWGAGRQQVCNIWTNVAVFDSNLWMHTLVESWAWRRSHEQLDDRSNSTTAATRRARDADRRPSHANRRKALRRLSLDQQSNALASAHSPPRGRLRPVASARSPPPGHCPVNSSPSPKTSSQWPPEGSEVFGKCRP
jgi:hypothetical protein